MKCLDREGWRLFGLLLGIGTLITFVHDYAYRRADTAGTGDYEMWGLISHAGTDMLIVTVAVSLAAVLWRRT